MRLLPLLLLWGNTVLSVYTSASTEIAPTDVWNLAKSIDDSIQRRYDIDSSYNKNYLTYSAKPRNVFQRVIFLAEEYNVIHPDGVDLSEVEKARKKEAEDIRPQDVYNVLLLIKESLVAENHWVEMTGMEGEKEPSDVYQMLRQISYHLSQAAEQLGLPAWAIPARVYEANCVQVLPMLMSAVTAAAGKKPDPFQFPKSAMRGIRPIDIFWLQRMIYQDIGEFYKKQKSYEPIKFEDPRHLNRITPADVFDLTQVIIGELKVLLGDTQELDSEIANRYAKWRTEKQHVLPGDVYHLVRYNLRLASLLVRNK